MSGHEHIRGLMGAVALGAATPGEQSEVERHVAGCHECRTELDGLRAAAAQLALEVPQDDPPAALKRRVMTAVRDDARLASRGHSPPRRRTWTWPALAAALTAAVVALIAWNVTLDRSDVVREIAITEVRTAPGATGLLVVREDGSAVIRVTGLPDLPPGQAYELWTIRGGTPRSEGFAARTPGGDLVAATAELDDATAVAITPESRSNVVAPTVEPLVLVSL